MSVCECECGTEAVCMRHAVCECAAGKPLCELHDLQKSGVPEHQPSWEPSFMHSGEPEPTTPKLLKREDAIYGNLALALFQIQQLKKRCSMLDERLREVCREATDDVDAAWDENERLQKKLRTLEESAKK